MSGIVGLDYAVVYTNDESEILIKKGKNLNDMLNEMMNFNNKCYLYFFAKGTNTQMNAIIKHINSLKKTTSIRDIIYKKLLDYIGVITFINDSVINYQFYSSNPIACLKRLTSSSVTLS